MRIIPAIDIIDGKCVRLNKGDYTTSKIYYNNPLEVAKIFEDNGIQFLHLVDLDGAKSQHIINHKVLYQITTKTSLTIDFGGGIKSEKDIQIAFENGAKQITGGSIAVQNKYVFLDWLSKYGAEKILLGADSKNRMIATNGWLEDSDIDVVEFISEYEKKGIKYVVCTDIAKDGMLNGTSTELYCEILEKTGVNLIASGGISSIQDLEDMKKIGCEGVIVGKAIYEEKITFKELQNFIVN